MEEELFTFEGIPVTEQFLRKIWCELGAKLDKHGYPVENVKMPRITMMIMTEEDFEQTMEQIRSSPHLYDTSKTEYGEENETCSALAFFSDVEQTWVILKRERGYSLRHDVRHELLHIWENALGLPWGILTSRFTLPDGPIVKQKAVNYMTFRDPMASG